MITITRRLAIIDKYVEVPNTKFEYKNAIDWTNAVASINGLKKRTINGSKIRSMNFVEYEPINAFGGTIYRDWYTDLKTLK